MRVVIDLQGAQGSNRKRGIGRYCLSLTRGMLRLRGEHEVIVVLSALFPETIDPIRAALYEEDPNCEILVFDAPGPVADADPGCDARREAAELIREQFISSLKPDFVLITSLFEGLGDDVISSIGKFDSRLPTATVLYDLIPLINREIYLKNPMLEKWYERKLAHLRNADLLLAISASSRREAIEWLGTPEGNVVNISTAAEEHFYPAAVTQAQRDALAHDYGLVRPFVMYTGGIDHRKNIEALIEAYAKLPINLRRAHQLAVVCSIEPADRARLTSLAKEAGLAPDELVLTGYIPEDDLLACYRACELFVFPSWHEGFGLPALEAMKCGRAVIASNLSSLPEVIGTPEALFDPYSVADITDAMRRVLEDVPFREKLEAHGLVQAEKFSWDATAKAAWRGLESSHRLRERSEEVSPLPSTRKRLAYFSPLPAENSGISDYSAELLPELARYYNIDVIAPQASVSDPYVQANLPLRDIAWFKSNAHRFDRIMYHFGNSHFHAHMFDLLKQYPGVVVLHDFFLSGIVAHRDVHGEAPGTWAVALLEEHGWPAVVHRFKATDTADVVWAYPCSLGVVQDAMGMIVHAEYSKKLAAQFYGKGVADRWHNIPHLREPARGQDKTLARETLGLAEDDFIVCSFGILGRMKMNDRLLAAWLKSPLASDPRCHLVFVGENNNGEYGDAIVRTIRGSRTAGRVEITGWADMATFRQWLAAADVGVQLRTLSRGETSGTVLDCMNAGLATIVNANGSMAELPSDTVWQLPDDFSDSELIEALTTLRNDERRRRELGARARKRIATNHEPRECARQYALAIESIYADASTHVVGLDKMLIETDKGLTEPDWLKVVRSVSHNAPAKPRRPRLYVDISELVQKDWGSGIQRVVRSILMNWLRDPPENFIVEPVYAIWNQPGYRSARQFTSKMLDIWPHWSEDELIEPVTGDIFVGLDLQPGIVPQQQDLLQQWRRAGVSVRFVVYDLLPVLAPQFFVPGARPGHHRWLETIAQFDGGICISKAVADEFYDWLRHYQPQRALPLDIDWFHLGGDKEQGDTIVSLSDDAAKTITAIKSQPSFLTVATIEPRKGFRQTLAAMELLWARNVAVNFVIVGKPGWLMDDFVAELRSHRELGKRLFWLEGIDDDHLHAVYQASFCLIAASEGEGFGLPLIEAAHHGLPVLARDIPVFREVAGDGARYFENSRDPKILAEAIEQAMRNGSAKADGALNWLTWTQSAEQLLDCLLQRKPAYRQWMPDDVMRLWGSDHRMHSSIGVHDGTSIRSTGQAGYLLYGPYTAMPAQSYRITAHGEASRLVGSEHIDVASSSGTKLHWKAQLGANGEKWRVDDILTFEKPIKDMEIRVWVDAETDLALEGIVLEPINPGEGKAVAERHSKKVHAAASA
ncbi:glycosyltransferase [Novosphingobium sp.]|uniref:glycosyltransferase n=1 Tax=Novosphingobium sp. TaxID=1874826 RepID=UPI002FDC8B05